MKALQFERSLARYGAAKVASSLFGSAAATSVTPLHLSEIAEPSLPTDSWHRVRPRLAGICGSDLSTITGKSTAYFEPIVSFPFVPGHEVVGDLDDDTRVVVEPLIGCIARGLEPLCDVCGAGHGHSGGRCGHLTRGHVSPGLQIGFCADTGGGWGQTLVAHASQVHSVPEHLSDQAAVMVEPIACAIHGALAAKLASADKVIILGAGTLGLGVLAGVRAFSTQPASITIAAKYPHQKAFAKQFGADEVCAPSAVQRSARRMSGSQVIGTVGDERLVDGVDVVIDCVGNASSIEQALRIVRPGGRVLLVGMPGHESLDLTALWHREISVQGAYAYGVENLPDGNTARTFDLALQLVDQADLGRLVTATYPLDHWRDAIEHAANAGSRGAVKIAFDPRNTKNNRGARS